MVHTAFQISICLSVQRYHCWQSGSECESSCHFCYLSFWYDIKELQQNANTVLTPGVWLLGSWCSIHKSKSCCLFMQVRVAENSIIFIQTKQCHLGFEWKLKNVWANPSVQLNSTSRPSAHLQLAAVKTLPCGAGHSLIWASTKRC